MIQLVFVLQDKQSHVGGFGVGLRGAVCRELLEFLGRVEKEMTLVWARKNINQNGHKTNELV